MGSQKGSLAVDDTSRSGSWHPSRQNAFKAVILVSVANERFARDTFGGQGEALMAEFGAGM